MNIAVKDRELGAALMRSPTQLWGGRLRNAVDIIKEGTLCSYDGVRVVEVQAWSRAMKICRALPAGGRHVAQENKLLWFWLGRALDVKGESK